MNGQRLYLSREKLIGGVAGGIAEYFGIDPTIVRLLFVVGLWANGITVALYIAGMIIIPERPLGDEYGYEDEASGMEGLRRAARSFTDSNNPKALGILLIGVGAVLLLRLFVSLDWSIILPVLLVLAGIALLVRAWRQG